MNLVRTVGGWTCMPASFATILGLTLEDMFKKVGHDGSQIVNPDLRDPERRRAFHPQEMIDVAESLGVAITPIEARPVSAPGFVVPLDIFPRWQRYLEDASGVLTGRNLIGRRHAVAWDGEKVLDPASGNSYEIHLFQPEVFWRAVRRGPSLWPSR